MGGSIVESHRPRHIKPSNLFYTHARLVEGMGFGLAKMIEEVRRSTSISTPSGKGAELSGPS